MERTDEVIYQRAAEEHIRRPPLWHDDEVDSVRVSLFTLCIYVPSLPLISIICQFKPFKLQRKTSSTLLALCNSCSGTLDFFLSLLDWEICLQFFKPTSFLEEGGLKKLGCHYSIKSNFDEF